MFEVQQAVRQHAEAAQRLAHCIGHGAQVFADHQAAVALAFQRHDGEHLIDRVVHVGAALRGAAGRDPEQAHEPHHVVDADRAGAAHAGAQHLDEGLVAGFAQPVGAQRRQAPVLPVGVELVGRRADAGAEREAILMAPGIRAGAVGRHRQILVEPDRHAQRAALLRHGVELTRALPLQVLEKADAVGVLPGELGHRLACGIAVRGGPDRPAPDLRVRMV